MSLGLDPRRSRQIRARAFKARFGESSQMYTPCSFHQIWEIKCICGLLVPGPDAMCQGSASGVVEMVRGVGPSPSPTLFLWVPKGSVRSGPLTRAEGQCNHCQDPESTCCPEKGAAGAGGQAVPGSAFYCLGLGACPFSLASLVSSAEAEVVESMSSAESPTPKLGQLSQASSRS